MLPKSEKKIRERAMRYKRSLINEERTRGYINDGSGKRYLIGPLFVLAGDLEKAIDHFNWYERKFPDDSGEPLHYIYWALALFQVGNKKEAKKRLLEALVQNIYMLPTLIGMEVCKYDIWHPSNFESPEYLYKIPEDMLPIFNKEERRWIQEEIDSFKFQRVLKEYIATYHTLKYEKEVEKRKIVIENWYNFIKNSLHSLG